MSHSRTACLAMLDRQLEQLEMDRALVKGLVLDKIDQEFNKLRTLTLEIKARIVKPNDHLPSPASNATQSRDNIAGGQSIETNVHDDMAALPSTSSSTNVGRKRKSSGNSREVARKSTRQAGFPCIYPGCGKSFSHDSALANHERTHTGVRPFSCTWPDCHFGAAKRNDMVAHIRTFHLKLPRNKKDQVALNITDDRDPNQWIRVNQQLASERLIQANIALHMNKVNNAKKVDMRRTNKKRNSNRVYPFACKSPGCGESFETSANRLQHERAIHLRVKPYGCTWPDCGFVASQRGQVVTHVRTVHFGLPQTAKLQRQMAITDERDPNQWVSINQDELKRRVE